jgi:hypothetical protein
MVKNRKKFRVAPKSLGITLDQYWSIAGNAYGVYVCAWKSSDISFQNKHIFGGDDIRHQS